MKLAQIELICGVQEDSSSVPVTDVSVGTPKANTLGALSEVRPDSAV